MMKSLPLSLLALAFATFAHGAGKELTGTYLPADTTCPSPEDARAKMTVPEGYRVECFAHEPMVQNPVAMTWDTRGRLWVVEAYEYPNGTELPVEQRPFGQEAKDDQYHPVPPQCIPTENRERGTENLPKDRVIILEDTDNDGVADKRTVFVEGLNLASAIICGDDGIYVGQQPHLIHFRDADHDDEPEQWRVVLTGFGREDTHELVNSFCWGPDGWLYMTHGVFTNSKVRRPGVPEKEGFKFDAGIGRCRPVQGSASVSPAATKAPNAGKMPALPWEFEVFADGTSNPWGCDYDERGNFFVSACVIDHFFHMAPGGIYVRQGGAPENPYAYEQLPSIVTHKHFRAAYAGVQIYQGGVYPQDTWGHAFIGNIHDNAIHEEVLTPVGSTFKCEPRRDFLRANNGWFRPVSTQTGPDGFLWVMDWCDKYPCYQNAKANPEGVDRERGRIWRVVYAGDQRSADTPVRNERLQASKDSGDAQAGKRAELARQAKPTRAPVASRPTKDMDLAKLSTPELVKLLEHPNNWMRRWARRVLVERRSTIRENMEWVSQLHELWLNKQANPGVRLESLWVLGSTNYIGALHVDSTPLTALQNDPDAGIRAWCARFLGEALAKSAPQSEKDHFPAIAAYGRAEEPEVRRAAAVALRQSYGQRLTVDRDASTARLPGRFMEPLAQLALEEMIANNAGADEPLQFSIWMALEPALVSAPSSIVTEFLPALVKAEPLSQTLTHKSMRRLCDTRDAKNLDLCLDFLAKIKAHDVLLAHALEGLVKGQEGGVIKPTKDFAQLLAEFAKSDNADVRKHASNLRVLWGDPAAIQQLAATMLEAKTPEAERIAALQTLRKVRSDEARKAYASVVAQVSDLGGAGLGSQSTAASKTPANDATAPKASASGPGSLPRATTGTASAFALEVIRAASDLGNDTFPKAIASGWAHLASALRVAALDTLASRPAWTHAMLDSIAANEISVTGFPATVRRQLATSQDKAIRDHAAQVLGVWKDSSDDIKALIAAKKKACLEGEPDLAQGKLMFQTTCAVCHTFYGGGQKVGPELIGSGRSNLDAILANVIDPNQIIGNGYENVIISTKDNRTLMGRVTEDAPSHVKLLAIGGAEQVVPRDQIAKLENTHQSLMPMGFGGLPDDQFRNLIWYVLSPPEEGPLTADKKKALSTSIDAAPTKPKSKWAAIDWESVSLWNPKWKVIAPEFERTPLKLAEYHGRKNVLLMHPFEDKKTPCALEHKLVIDAAHPRLKFAVAADDRGDWMVRVVVNGQAVKELPVNHEAPRWKDVVIDLSAHAGKEVTVRLEGHATGWTWEFSYWDQVRWE